jgi:hypothetical protein
MSAFALTGYGGMATPSLEPDRHACAEDARRQNGADPF